MTTLSLQPLTRIEGHGRVELTLEQGRVTTARVAVTEPPRLFETLLVGRSGLEVPALVCRICAICSAVHRVAACRALERALSIEAPPLAEAIRELLLLGGHIESHALHLFCLVLPDLEGGESIVELLRRGSVVAREGLALKAFGNRLQELAGGRVIHPVNVEVGGVRQRPSAKGLALVAVEAEQWLERMTALAVPFVDPKRFPPSVRAEGVRIAVRQKNGLTLTGEELALSDGRVVSGEYYRTLLAERPVPYSQAKHPGSIFLAGAMARQELSGEVAGREGELPSGIHGNSAAQVAELSWALERCRTLAKELLQGEAEALAVPVRVGPGRGTAVVEAPRGLLIHHYVLDDLGRIAAADIVTPTTINQPAMEAQLFLDLQDAPEAEVAERAQRIVRAYDPCISCSVHLIRR